MKNANVALSDPCFIIVAGEISGDNLGASLIEALKQRYPTATFYGIGGRKMIEAGLVSWFDMETLSIMGLIEIIKHLPTLIKLKKKLIERVIKENPSAYIGIDAPEFNLRVEKELKRYNIKTIHYVSPSIWVWRRNRIYGIKRAVDLMLTLFPFETELYTEHHVPAVWVGHPMADEIALSTDTLSARTNLGLDASGTVIALLPGSRRSEIDRLLPLFLATAQLLHQKNAQLDFIIPAASEYLRNIIEPIVQAHPLKQQISVVSGAARTAMAASNAVLLASGTATLECLFLKKPMVAAYRFNFITAWLAPKIVYVKYFSLPNLLTDSPLIPEFYQDAAQPQALATSLSDIMQLKNQSALTARFLDIHQYMRRNASERAADAIAKLLASSVIEKGGMELQ